MSSSSLVPSPSASAIVTLDRVAARTPDGHPRFSDLSLAFGRERMGVVGRNGTGRTTLLRPASVGMALPGWDGAPVGISHDGDFLAAIGVARILSPGQPQPETAPRRRAAAG